MKKKFLGFIFVMVLVLISAMPVFADENGETPSGTPAGQQTVNVVSKDADVQAAYEAYFHMVDSMNANKYDAMKDYYDACCKLINNFTEDQQAEWNRVMDTDALGNLIDAANIIYAVELEEKYQANPNAKTAYEFVQAYEECLAAEIQMDAMVSGIEDAYKEAKKAMPSENVQNVYNAYLVVEEALESGEPSELADAITAFEKVIDVFNDLTDEEFADLAAMMEVSSDDADVTDGEYAFNIIFIDWIDINVLESINTAYSAFVDNPTAENAEALIDVYEDVFPENEADAVVSATRIYAFFPDIDDVYADALQVLEEDAAKATDVSNATSGTPQTGDDFNVQIPLMIMLVSAAVAGLTIKRKRVQ